MAKLYEKLRDSLICYANRPKENLEKQSSDESVFLIRGQDKGRHAWHYILVPLSNQAALKAKKDGSNIDVSDYGKIIKYCDNQGRAQNLSGWGINPHKLFQKWTEKQFESPTIDENVDLKYECDDIRLCIMQRAVPEQLIGIARFYRKNQCMHFIKLSEDSQSSLAYRGGLKSYDRIIELNGVNIENDTRQQLYERFRSQLHLPVEMLVCSPSTYQHYKANNMTLHSDLPTIQRLKPVYATSVSDSNVDSTIVTANDDSFCVVEWINGNTITIVTQSSVFKAPQFIHLNDICFVEIKKQYRKGKILFIGSYEDCNKIESNQISQSIRVSNSKCDFTVYEHKSDTNQITKMFKGLFLRKKGNQSHDTNINSKNIVRNGTNSNEEIQRNDYTLIEHLPNELLYDLFSYMDIQTLFKSFWELNSRFNQLIQSCHYLHLTFDESVDQSLMRVYAPYVNELTLVTSIDCDFHQFPNLKTLVVCNQYSKHMSQITPNNIPNLKSLSFILGSSFNLPSDLLTDVFTNGFPFLSHANLGSIQKTIHFSCSTSPSLRFLSIHADTLFIISRILAACPNLHHLQLLVSSNSNINTICSSSLNHSLQVLTLWSDEIPLTLDDINVLLSYTPNIYHLYLQTVYATPFIKLAKHLINRLNRLSQFDCHIREILKKENRAGDANSLHLIHPCFNRIQCKVENDEYRIFTTQ